MGQWVCQPLSQLPLAQKLLQLWRSASPAPGTERQLQRPGETPPRPRTSYAVAEGTARLPTRASSLLQRRWTPRFYSP